MKIESIYIKNLRAFEEETLSVAEFTALVGANGAGKSTVLCALNIFFRETENALTNMSDLDAEDFHLRDTSQPIIVTVTFAGLSERARELFADYVRHDKLVISARADFDPNTGKAFVQQYGERLVMPELAEYFAADSAGAKVDDLRVIFASLKSKFTDIADAKTKEAMRKALRDYEEARPEQCKLEPSQDQFYGFSKGANRLAECVQWVYVPAVKDATKEQLEARTTALGRLLARTVRSAVQFEEELLKLHAATMTQYQTLLDERQAPLAELSAKLQARLSDWAHPDVKVSLAWQQDPKKSVQIEAPFARMIAGEGDFEGELARFGHGLQRSYLLALLQELAAADDTDAPTLILGIEEPELYQHPPQARHLASVLQKLSTGNAQIIVSTHSPHFVTGKGFEAVRMVRRISAAKKSVVTQCTADDIAKALTQASGAAPVLPTLTFAKLNQALQPGLNEMFFTPSLILVEGLEDVALITSWLVLTDKWEEFRRRGCHLVAANGKSELAQPLTIAQKLGIPTFTMFDADGSYAGKKDQAPKHEHDNRTLLALLGGDTTNLFPTNTLWGENYVVWPENIQDALRVDVGDAVWDKLHNEANALFGNPKGFGKNAMHVGARLAIAHEQGIKLPTLDQLCDQILKFSS